MSSCSVNELSLNGDSKFWSGSDVFVWAVYELCELYEPCELYELCELYISMSVYIFCVYIILDVFLFLWGC